jgi:hypothetical protein
MTLTPTSLKNYTHRLSRKKNEVPWNFILNQLFLF